MPCPHTFTDAADVAVPLQLLEAILDIVILHSLLLVE